MLRVNLDKNCIIQYFEKMDQSVIKVIRHALERRMDLAVTSRTSTDIERDKLEERKISMLRRLEQFPLLEMDSSVVSHDDYKKLKHDLQNLLFPDLNENDPRYANKISDVEHLTAHTWHERDYFVTYDQHLLKRADEVQKQFNTWIATPSECLEEIEASLQKQLSIIGKGVSPTIIIREFEPGDRRDIFGWLCSFKNSYPKVDSWAKRTLDEAEKGEARCVVACVGDSIAGVAISKLKGDGVAKLSHFSLKDQFRGLAVGPHLLWHELQNWAAQKINLFYVTLASDMVGDLVGFFQRYGFASLGMAPQRYREGSCEFVMGKIFAYGQVDESGFEDFVRKHVIELFGCRIVSEIDSGFIIQKVLVEAPIAHRKEVGVRIVTEPGLTCEQINNISHDLVKKYGSGTLISFHSVLERPTFPNVTVLDSYDIECLFYPVELVQTDAKAVIIPIKRQWAEVLLEYPRPQEDLFPPSPSRLLLRTDNVYYRYPTDFDILRRGTRILFYVTEIHGVVGEAKIVVSKVDFPEQLYMEYGPIGVYRLSDIEQHITEKGENAGKALAIKFDWYKKYRRPVRLKDVREIIESFNPQTAYKITWEQLERIREAGGV